MCGRYTLACPDEESLIRALPFDAFSETRIQFRPRYNIAPGQQSPVVYLRSGKPILVDALWGVARAEGPGRRRPIEPPCSATPSAMGGVSYLRTASSSGARKAA